jgi:hypothetical protein
MLTLENIQSACDSPSSKDSLRRAQELQGWLLFYNKYLRRMGCTSSNEARAKNLFFEFVRSLLPSQKADRYIQNFQNDLPELLGNVMTEYKRVHTSEDRNVNAYFSSQDNEMNFEKYRKEVLKDEQRMKNEGTAKLMTSPNSYVVVTPPNISGSFWWIDIEDIVDVYETKASDSVEYIVFKSGGMDDSATRT